MGRSPAQIVAAGFTGGLIGGLGGAAVSTALDLQWWVGGLIGVVVLGGVSAWADARRVPGRPQPLWVRIVFSTAVAAVIGWFLDIVLPDWPAWIPATVVGALAGGIGFRGSKLVLGAFIGLVSGLAFDIWADDVGWAVVVAVTVLIYRSLAGWWWRGRDQVRIMGEKMAPESARYVVPFAEVTGHVGVDYLERHAGQIGASFARSPADIGIIDNLDRLGSLTFEPAHVHLLVREFYEHTSRFRMSIVPEWRPWMRIPYRIYRKTIAGPMGQANAPFEIEEVQHGVVSWIDTIDLDDDGVADVRAWVRAYEDGTPIYVGIYTVQEIDGVSYVAVGFPLPSANFTATLVPSNNRGDGLLLASHSDAPHAGHYLSFVEGTGELTTLQLGAFGEEIDVFVSGDELKTEHHFTLAGVRFLTLHYIIERNGR